MTAEEYRKLYVKARGRTGRLTLAAMRELKKAYVTAGELVSEVVRDAKARSLSELTIQSREAIRQQLSVGANNIRDELQNVLPSYIRKTSDQVTKIDAEYLYDIIPDGANITKAGISAVAAAVNERVVQSVINRMFSDGYTLSERIWRVGSDYQTQISRVISAGFAQGRDPVKIALDIEKYIADGKIVLAKRYGPNLTANTKAWLRRIRKEIDYRALRLVRSELYMSLQDAGRESGRANPGAQNLYDWILNAGRQEWDCVCPSNAAGSPYEYDKVPSFPHPHCACRVQARLRDRREFVQDLRAWVNGSDIEYLDSWYREYYVPAVGG